MTEATKEINIAFPGQILDYVDTKEHLLELFNYITNLQQDLDKANDIIEKDRQFYKCRMDEYVELKKENERLKEDNKSYQEYPFIIIEKNGVICRKNQEIERLNNIINGMENFFEYEYDNEVRPLNDRKISVWTICLDKLKELKESGNNE